MGLWKGEPQKTGDLAFVQILAGLPDKFTKIVEPNSQVAQERLVLDSPVLMHQHVSKNEERPQTP